MSTRTNACSEFTRFWLEARHGCLVGEPASLNLAHRWHLGYALDEDVPDHFSLTRIQQRLGRDVFQRFFEQVVDLCQEAGLVRGRELFFDAIKVQANADLDSLVPRFSHDAKTHMGSFFADDPEPSGGHEGDHTDLPPADGLLSLPAREVRTEGLTAPEPAPRWKLLQERRLDPHRLAVGSYRRTTDFRGSPTDPDATPMQTRHGTVLGRHDHDVVDGGKRRIILAAFVTSADVMENVPMRELLWRVCFRRKLWPAQVTGDTTYGTIKNIGASENAGIRAYVPLPAWGSRRPEFFAQTAFTYDAVQDEFRCPQRQPLSRETAKYGEQVVVYRAEPRRLSLVWRRLPIRQETWRR